MRIAWVSPYLPAPATSGGAIRQQRLARSLASVAELHLFARGEPWEKPRLDCPELEIFQSRWLGRDYAPSWLGRSGSALEATSSTRVRRGSPRAVWRAVAAAHAHSAFDGVVVSHCWAALGARELGLPWILDEHNVESRYYRELQLANGKGGARVTRELASLELWERKSWQHASSLSCVSAADSLEIARYRSQAPDRRVCESLPLVVPNGADLERLAFISPKGRRGGVLFVGSLHHRPNLDAALRLLLHIMPRVWAASPRLGLTLVGGPVPKVLHQAAGKAGGPVTLAGRVADVAPYLATESVFASPLVHGAGSSLKAIEALAAGIPLVSSRVGTRGFGLIAGEHYANAETDDEFASGILEAAWARDVTCERALAGRRLAEPLAWKTIGADFANHVIRALGGTRAR